MWFSLVLSAFASTAYFPVLVVVQIALWFLGTALYLDHESMLSLLLSAVPATGVLCTMLLCKTTPTSSGLH